MVSRSRVVYGLVGAAATVVTAGVAGGSLIARNRRRAGRIDGPQRFDDLDPDRTSVIRTEDGVALYVEEVGPQDAPLTVVFAHGYTLSLRSFHFQRRALADAFGDSIRMVFYDQRSHGESAESVPSGATIDQLGRDLYTVIDAVVPTGPIVLVGHSMGGMTVLSLAHLHHELFADGGAGARGASAARVRGVALLSTSSGEMATVNLGLPALLSRLRGPLAPMLLRTARRQAALVEHSRRLGRDIAWVVTRRFSFSDKNVSPDVVDFLNDIISGTRIETIVDFYPAIMSYDLTDALPVLAATDVLIISGETDVMIPTSHSLVMAQALPRAEFIAIPGAGHVVTMERPDVVDEALQRMVATALESSARRPKARLWRGR